MLPNGEPAAGVRAAAGEKACPVLLFNKNEKARKILDEGLGRIRQGDRQGGLEKLNAAIQTAPKFAPALVARAQLMAEAGRPDQALGDIDQVIEVEPDIASHYFFRGLCQRVLNRPNKAIADFDQCLRLEPDHSEAVLEISSLLVRQERLEEALPFLDRAVELKPDDVGGRLTRARALIALRQPERALDDVGVVGKQQPHSIEALRLGARALLMLRQYNEAVTLARRALQLIEAEVRPDNKSEVAQINLEYAQALDRAGQAKDALVTATRAVTMDPTNNEALFFRGAMLQSQGRSPEAMEDYSELLHRCPGWVPVLINRAGCYLDRGQAQRALSDASAALTKAPDQPIALFNRARAQIHVGDWMAAGADLTGLLERFPKDPAIWLERARVWHAAGRPDECADDRYEAVKRDAKMQHEPLEPVKGGRFITSVEGLRHLFAPV